MACEIEKDNVSKLKWHMGGTCLKIMVTIKCHCCDIYGRIKKRRKTPGNASEIIN